MSKKGLVEHSGKIIAIENHKIKVEILNKSMCAGCHAKSVCALGDSKEKVIDVMYFGDNELVVGEEVSVVMEKSMGFKAVWISYVIPMVILLVFLLFLSQFYKNELLIGALSLLGVSLYYIVIYIFRDKIANSFRFKLAKKF